MLKDWRQGVVYSVISENKCFSLVSYSKFNMFCL